MPHQKSERYFTLSLTTNFDPLLEVAIRKNGGLPQSVFLSNDGSFDNILSDNNRNVVHLHGYWHGSDTLHTTEQITRNRPLLRGCLRKLLNEKMLVVFGYGGWDDSFTSTLVEIALEGGQNYNIAWTFFEEDEAILLNKYGRFIDKFGCVLGQRVVLYKGIDCDKFFPKLHERIIAKKTEKIHVDHGHKNNDSRIEVKIEKSKIFSCDPPPSNRNWVGRFPELSSLSDGNYKTIFITGIGGQGKSSLASEYIRAVNDAGEW